jgi:hypothetical protein
VPHIKINSTKKINIKSKAQVAKQTHRELKISQEKTGIGKNSQRKPSPSNQFHSNKPFQIIKKKNLSNQKST